MTTKFLKFSNAYKNDNKATLKQLDTEFELFVPTIQVNPVTEIISTGSVIIQDLPTLS